MQLDNSIILLDKPYGPTSHEISAYVKKLLGLTRTGHAGTLDPQVSGVLPVALGRATKLLRYIIPKRKSYVGIIKFRDILPQTEIKKLFSQFTGELIQTPPKKSAVRKIARKRTVYSLELLELNGRLGLFKAEVDAGTYIRVLCEDIGKKCGGARMEELRRTAVGSITEKQTVTITQLIDAVWQWKNGDPSALEKMLYAPEEFIHFPQVVIKQSAVPSILNGASIAMPALVSYPRTMKKGEHVALYDESHRFIGVGILAEDVKNLLNLRRGIAIKPERVHISKPL